MYGSIGSKKVNVRVGPGTQYPISWVYKQKGWPIEAIAKHQGWYKIRDNDGEEGWIHGRFFSKTRYTLTESDSIINMYKKPDGKKIIMLFEPGVPVKLLECQLSICGTSYANQKGWIERKNLHNTKDITK
jgi:SH3-like domain-containing protein